MANLQDITNRSEVGTIKPWGKATAPAGYLLCDGSAVSRTTYADLFAVLSTTYGSGNGSTTFNVPDLQDKFPQGKSGTTNLATTGGANTVTVSVTNNQSLANNQSVTITGNIDNTSLTTAQLASHSHSGATDGTKTATAAANPTPNRAVGGLPNANTGNAGSGTAHNHGHNLSGTMSGTVALSGTVAASGTNSFSPFVIVQYIIKH
jgi:microcystin-dependent protein